MKHLPDLLTLRHRRPLFRSSLFVRLSTFMSKFDIYVKFSILINYKTKQPSNCMKHLPDLLTLQHGHPLFRCPFVHRSVSTFISKFDIYVTVSVLINYNSTTTIIPCMTHLPDLLTLQVYWPSDLDLYFVLQWLWHNLRWRSRSSQL